PEIRYIKPLKSFSSPHVTEGLAPDEVYTFSLGRSSGFTANRQPSSAVVHSASCIVHSKGPFLGFKYLGPSFESDHLRDYAAESLAADLAHERELRSLRTRSAREALVDGFIDGSYGRYLKGE
ncbi:MAG: hypothetical protein ABJB40_10955, partial [Acidobacteriota bacterium]